MSQQIDIIRPKVTLKIGDVKLEMEHADLESLLYKLAGHLGRYIYTYPYFGGHINVASSGAGFAGGGLVGGTGVITSCANSSSNNIEIGELK